MFQWMLPVLCKHLFLKISDILAHKQPLVMSLMATTALLFHCLALCVVIYTCVSGCKMLPLCIWQYFYILFAIPEPASYLLL